MIKIEVSSVSELRQLMEDLFGTVETATVETATVETATVETVTEQPVPAPKKAAPKKKPTPKPTPEPEPEPEPKPLSQLDVAWKDMEAYKESGYINYLRADDDARKEMTAPIQVLQSDCKPFIIENIDDWRALVMKYYTPDKLAQFKATYEKFLINSHPFSCIPQEHLYAFVYVLFKELGLEIESDFEAQIKTIIDEVTVL